MRELYERPGSKCASLPLYYKWGNDSVHNVFDGSLLLHAGKKSV